MNCMCCTADRVVAETKKKKDRDRNMVSITYITFSMTFNENLYYFWERDCKICDL